MNINQSLMYLHGITNKLFERKASEVFNYFTFIQTTHTAPKGDYIVTNLATKAKESYIISPEKFITRYKKISTIFRGVGLYNPTGKVRAISLTKSLLDTMKWKDQFYILAPWEGGLFGMSGDG